MTFVPEHDCPLTVSSTRLHIVPCLLQLYICQVFLQCLVFLSSSSFSNLRFPAKIERCHRLPARFHAVLGKLSCRSRHPCCYRNRIGEERHSREVNTRINNSRNHNKGKSAGNGGKYARLRKRG